jgi:glycosyltransferase involved in cell wall biosynthesis
VVLSKAVGEQVRSLVDKPVVCEPHPLYDSYGQIQDKAQARQALGLPLDKPLVLFFGFIRAYKGLDLLLDAMLAPALQAADVQLLVAGEFYESEEKYEAKLQPIQAQGRLHLHTQFIPDEKVALYFSAADLVVQPYRNATQSGISQLAYHFELPMIVTQVGGLGEIVEDGRSGYVVPVEVSAIAGAIADFFENQRSQQLKQGLVQLKKRFSWDNLAKACLGTKD